MLSRIRILIMSTVVPWAQGPSRRGLAVRDGPSPLGWWWWYDDVNDDRCSCDSIRIDVVLPFCLVVLAVLVVIAVMYHGQTIIASIQISDPSFYFELLDFCKPLYLPVIPCHQNPTQPPVFDAAPPPRNPSKNGVFIPKSRLFYRFLTVFCP